MPRPVRRPGARAVTSKDESEQLHSLLAVTDRTLARLDVEDLLLELLDRIRSVLYADTAAVLLRDGDSDALVARAACGLEEEVRQGVRVLVGTGFAGSIAKRKCPVVLDRVDSTTVANPILWEKGIRTMLGVPLLSGEDVFGVLHVGRRDHRRSPTTTPSCCKWPPSGSLAPRKRDSSPSSPPPPGCSNAACSPAAYRACPVSSWPPAMSGRRAD